MVSILCFVKNVRGFRASSLVTAFASGMPNSTLTAFAVCVPATSTASADKRQHLASPPS